MCLRWMHNSVNFVDVINLTESIISLGAEVKQEDDATKEEPSVSSPSSAHEPMDAETEAAA